MSDIFFPVRNILNQSMAVLTKLLSCMRFLTLHLIGILNRRAFWIYLCVSWKSTWSKVLYAVPQTTGNFSLMTFGSGEYSYTSSCVDPDIISHDVFNHTIHYWNFENDSLLVVKNADLIKLDITYFELRHKNAILHVRISFPCERFQFIFF